MTNFGYNPKGRCVSRWLCLESLPSLSSSVISGKSLFISPEVPLLSTYWVGVQFLSLAFNLGLHQIKMTSFDYHSKGRDLLCVAGVPSMRCTFVTRWRTQPCFVEYPPRLSSWKSYCWRVRLLLSSFAVLIHMISWDYPTEHNCF